MKAILAATSIALPLALAACDHRKTTDREMHSGAEKVADGVKEMSHAAGQKLEAAGEKAKEKIHEATAPD
jgi:hypothetical protein